jgi:hypothetical protein
LQLVLLTLGIRGRKKDEVFSLTINGSRSRKLALLLVVAVARSRLS